MSGQPGVPLVELKHVDRSFMKDGQILRVLQDVNIEVFPNETICIVGESGCGKTTTGKIIAGLLGQSGGQVLVEGKPRESYTDRQEIARLRRTLQIVHQDPFASLNPAHTVEKILSFPLLRHRKVANRTELAARLVELMNLVDLTPAQDILSKYPHQLSGGQRQRVSIARALTVQPKLIVADEAVSMVDVSIRIGLLKMLHRLRAELGLAIVFITHDLALAKYFAWEGRIAVMYLGRVVEIGRTPDVIGNPAHPYTRALLAAVPEADPDVTRQKQELPLRSEDIPGLLDIPPGCAFHPRCPFFERGTCDVTLPDLRVPPGHQQITACTPLTRDGKLTAYAGG
ncbi:MAG: ABC transporter ATP-binding protein [Chloroflexi bacterium]|nr:ABC transporter ATP-binding protein [Chloroflexota bacterium]